MIFSWPRKLIFVRHAESVGNVIDNEARTALPMSTHAYKLTERGVWQAKVTGQWLQRHHDILAADAYFTSYYVRAQETMSLLVSPLKKEVFEDARLAEAQRGIYHALPKAVLAERFPEELARKDLEGLYHYRPPGGENWLDVELRIHSFIDMLRRDYAGRNVLVVGHGHWFLMFQKVMHRWSAEDALHRYTTEGTVENASVTIYEDRSHVDGGPSKLRVTEGPFAPWAEIAAKEKARLEDGR